MALIDEGKRRARNLGDVFANATDTKQSTWNSMDYRARPSLPSNEVFLFVITKEAADCGNPR
ncbi:MAG TPA: hypothetical protein VL069_09945, partial [Opitutus sp.]|nr:hypothetical protein [Opitutus sp.]